MNLKVWVPTQALDVVTVGFTFGLGNKPSALDERHTAPPVVCDPDFFFILLHSIVVLN